MARELPEKSMRLKCFFGKEVQDLEVKRDLTAKDLLQLLSQAFHTQVKVVQYEDEESDLVSVGQGGFDVAEACVVYDTLCASAPRQARPALKLYLARPTSTGRAVSPPQQPALPLSHSTPVHLRARSDSDPTSPLARLAVSGPTELAVGSFNNGSSSAGHDNLRATNGTHSTESTGVYKSTPPLRTPPRTPPRSPDQSPRSSSPASSFGLDPGLRPPLRTPPPSPPPSSPRKTRPTPLGETTAIEVSTSETSSSSFLHQSTDLLRPRSSSSASSGPKPPLRTPPPSPRTPGLPRRPVPDGDFAGLQPGDRPPDPRDANGHVNGFVAAGPADVPVNKRLSGVSSGGSGSFFEPEDGSGLQPPLNWKRGQVLGRGGFGDVYLGLNTETGELLAVKQLQLDSSSDQRAKQSMLAQQQELEVLKKLRHPNIVRYVGTQIEPDRAYIFLEFMPGGSIASMLTKFGAFSEPVVRVYAGQILAGLQYLHEQSVIHRDIKGANILVDANGACKLADFGCSRIFQDLQNSRFKSVLGTPYWMAPEVIRGEPYGRSADIWSLGCTLIEMATGVPPWIAEFPEPQAAMFHIASTSDLPPTPTHLSSELADVLAGCFQRDPSMRPDASELLRLPPFRRSDARSSRDLGRVEPVELPATPSLSSLPSQLLLHVFSMLDDSEFPAVRQVCRAWRFLMEDDFIWRFKTLQRWRRAARDRTEGVSWKSAYRQHLGRERLWSSGPMTSTSLKGGHTKPINRLLLQDDLLVSCADDKTVRLWSVAKRKPQRSLKGHTAPVLSLAFAQDQQRIWSGGADKMVLLWEPNSKKQLLSFEAHGGPVTALDAAGGRLATGSNDKLVRLWDATLGRLVTTFGGHTDTITGVQVAEQIVVSCSTDGSVRVFDVRMEKSARTMKGHKGGLTCVWFDQSRHAVLSGSIDATSREWDVGTGRCVATFLGHENAVRCLAADADKLVTGSADQTVRIFDRHSETCLRTLVGHSDAVTSVRFDAAGRIASAGRDRTIRLWSLAAPEAVAGSASPLGSPQPTSAVPLARSENGSSPAATRHRSESAAKLLKRKWF